ncbi:MAG: EF-P lysine aminoacylase EpmA [Gammaproteobacteria bacterium]
MRSDRVKTAPAARRSVAWRPTADLEQLRLRAAVLGEVRAFFQARGVLEVETPLLCHAAASDTHLASMSATYHGPGAGAGGEKLWLQTSPEFAMKRLLAAGSGPIYQVCKAFRNGEAGGLHHPEFTILEWYRPGMDHHELMVEVEALLRYLMGEDGTCTRLSYGEAFRRHAGIDPHSADGRALRRCFASQVGVPVEGVDPQDRDAWLDLILTHLVEPNLGLEGPLFLYDYPASQAALARIRPGNPPLAERFELYMDGIEIANGYHEVICRQEQQLRFERDRRQRRRLGLADAPLDQRLLAALEHGLPPCAGVALGLDRLLMVLAGASCIEEVLAFPLERA